MQARGPDEVGHSGERKESRENVMMLRVQKGVGVVYLVECCV